MTETEKLRSALSVIASEVDPVDLGERVLAESRRIRVRRTVGAAAVVAAVAAGAIAVPLARLTGHPPQPPGVGPSVPAPAVLPTEAPDNAPDFGPFTSATVTVPTWGTAADAACSTGRVEIRNGFYQHDAAHRPVNVLSYVAADVDRDGTEDYVAHLMCGEGPEAGGSQIVAFRRSGAEFVPIGRVVGTQDGFAMMDYLQARPGGRIAVLVSRDYTDSGQDTVPNQWRTYAWQGGRFRQVDGPTSFPAQPPVAVLSVQATQLSFQPVGRQFVGRMTVTVSNTGAVDVARVNVLLVLPAETRPAGDGWTGCSRRTAENATAVVCSVSGLRAHSTIPLALTLVATGKPTPIDDPNVLGNHYVSIDHVPPFDGQVTYGQMEAVIPVNVR